MKWWLIGILAGAVGLYFLFVPPQIVLQHGLGIGRHNDRVLVGALAFIVSAVSFYKLMRKA